jgi:hypothetical protein
MTSSEIDNAILAVAESHWSKVAMVIVRAAERLGPDLPDGDAGYNLIGARIGALVATGRLASQGDISKWRQSEIRLR